MFNSRIAEQTSMHNIKIINDSEKENENRKNRYQTSLNNIRLGNRIYRAFRRKRKQFHRFPFFSYFLNFCIFFEKKTSFGNIITFFF